MYHKYLGQKSFFEFLYKIDMDLAQETKNRKCPHCSAVIHVANYMRKPRGMNDLPDDFSLCFSFCCSIEGCRKRAKPESLRFLDRFVYWSVHVVLISAMLNGRASEFKKIATKFGIAMETLKRWRLWWSVFFPTTKRWKDLKGKILGDAKNFPIDLLALVEKSSSEKDYIVTFLHLLNGPKGPI